MLHRKLAIVMPKKIAIYYKLLYEMLRKGLNFGQIDRNF